MRHLLHLHHQPCPPGLWPGQARFGRTVHIAATVLALLLGHPARATAEPADRPIQTWRCTSATGHISYSQQPCGPGGEPLTFKDERTHGQRRQAADNHERAAKLARRLQRERHRAERAAARQGPISLSGKGGPHVIPHTANGHAPQPANPLAHPARVNSPPQTPSSASTSTRTRPATPAHTP